MHTPSNIAQLKRTSSSPFHAKHLCFPQTPRCGLLVSTMVGRRTPSHDIERPRHYGRSNNQHVNLLHSWNEALEVLSTQPLEHASELL